MSKKSVHKHGSCPLLGFQRALSAEHRRLEAQRCVFGRLSVLGVQVCGTISAIGFN